MEKITLMVITVWQWVPLQGENHTHGIKCPTSVKTSVQQAEEHYLENKRNKLKSDFDFITSEMDHALPKVLAIRTKIDDMEKDLVEWCTTAENAKSKLIRLQAKMLLLGVHCDVTKWLNLDPNLITPAYKKIISSTPQKTTPTMVLVQALQTTLSVTVSAPTTVHVQTLQTTLGATVWVPTTSGTLSQLSQTVSQSGVVTQSRATGSQTGVVDVVQSRVVSTAEASASTVHQISPPVGMSATIPQGLIPVNILTTPTAPTSEEVSIRWGRILKGNTNISVQSVNKGLLSLVMWKFTKEIVA